MEQGRFFGLALLLALPSWLCPGWMDEAPGIQGAPSVLIFFRFLRHLAVSLQCGF